MPTSLPRTLVLDLDGTLVDSNRDLVPALNAAITSVGLPPIEAADVLHTSGKGARAMIAKAFELHQAPLDPATHDRLFERFLNYYNAHIADFTVFYPGALETLENFQSNGWLLAICTNKLEAMAIRLMDTLDHPLTFSAITGQDTFATRKPHPGHLIETVRLAGGTPERAIMVGDTSTDIDTALAANIPVIAVEFGYSGEPVQNFGPDRVISHFDQLKPTADELSKDWA